MFEVKRQQERAAGEDGSFFTLVYNEQHAPAERWFGANGWTAEATSLPKYLRDVGRTPPADGTEEWAMLDAIGLVSAVRG